MSGLLCLKWNNHSPAFLKHLSKLRIKEHFCDATIVCHNKFFSVHKFVLSTCSEYFEEIFEKTQCKHPFIIVKDIQSSELEALLDYMYKGEVNVLQELLPGLLKAAECLKVKGLAVPEGDIEDASQSTSRKTKRDRKNEHSNPVPHKRSRQSYASILEREETPQVHESDVLLLKKENEKVSNNYSEPEDDDSNSGFNSKLNQAVVTNIKMEPDDNLEAICEVRAVETANEYSFDKNNSTLKDESLSPSVSVEDFGALGLSKTSILDEPQCSSWEGLVQTEGGGDSNTRFEGFQDDILQLPPAFHASDEQLQMEFQFPKNQKNVTEYNCPHCSYSSHVKRNLLRHIMHKHTGEKPFACTLCHYKTVQKSALLRHSKIHLVTAQCHTPLEYQ